MTKWRPRPAERVLAIVPVLRFRVRAHRAFLARATRYLASEAGIKQVLDIGTGIPSANNTHWTPLLIG